MKHRIRLAVTVAVLVLHALALFAAYASAQPSPGFNDVCSVYGKAPGNRSLGAPLPLPGQHAQSHCALCSAGTAFAALSPHPTAHAFASTPGASTVRLADCAVIAAAPMLSPPSRGPPHPYAAS